MWTKMDYQKLIRAEIQKERKIKGQKDDKEDSKDIQTTSKELRWSSKIEWRRKWGGGWHQDRLIFWNLFHVFEKRCYLSLRCNRWSCFPLKKRQEVCKHMNQESQGTTFLREFEASSLDSSQAGFSADGAGESALPAEESPAGSANSENFTRK